MLLDGNYEDHVMIPDSDSPSDVSIFILFHSFFDDLLALSIDQRRPIKQTSETFQRWMNVIQFPNVLANRKELV